MCNVRRLAIFIINTLTLNLFVKLIFALDQQSNSLDLSIKSTLSYTVTMSNQIMEELFNSCSCEQASRIPIKTTNFYITGPFTWFEAWKDCKNRNGHLAFPSNENDTQVSILNP
jgi:hypothetical protein